MAAKDSDSGAIKKQELDDMTTCCICTEVYTNPKALPCIHTFCMKCLHENGLKTNKGPGDEMPCPICRRMFQIPPEGFRGLPKNFFIEKLIQASNISDHSATSRVVCDACLDENKEEAEKEIPEADAHCVECKLKLCQQCCTEHRKLIFTKNHKLIPMTEHEGGQNLMTNLVGLPSVCKLHEQMVLNVYCADCKTVVCAFCFIDDHKNHQGSDVNKYVDGFQKQLESNSKAINECRTQAETRKAELLKVKEDIQKKVEALECDTENRKDEVKQLADKHATSLLQGLSLIRHSKLKEIQLETGDIETYLSSIETYNSYCQKIMAKGSASDICRAFSDLSVRAVELQVQSQPMIQREIQSFNFHFRKSELEAILKQTCENMIGEIEEEGDSKPKKKSKHSLLTEENNEIDLLRKEIEIERTEKESLRLANEHLRITRDKEIQSNEVLIVELEKEKANYDSCAKKLKQELDKNKTTNSTLQANNGKLKQELDARNMTDNSSQTNIDKLKKELDKEKITNNSIKMDKVKLQQDLDKEKLTNNSLQASNKKLVQEVNVHETKIKILEDNVEKLKQELETMIKDKIPYKSDPVLVQTIKTKAAEEGKKPICGMTILAKELFVVSEKSSEVEVYDTIKLSFNRRWKLMQLCLNTPSDIGSCNRNKCLYICDYRYRMNTILRVDPNGELIKKWSTGSEYGYSVSVTDDSNVILAVYNKNKLNEYSPDGQLLREVILSSDAGIGHLKHAIRLSNDHFVVCHGFGSGALHRVCVVDADGKLEKSFGGKCGSSIGQMHVPAHLSVDGNGFVMIADRGNQRVLLLDPDLKFKRVILSKEEKYGLRFPFRILLDESNGRVFVADNGWDSEKKIFIDGRILIFDFK